MKRLILPFLALFIVFGFKVSPFKTITGTIVDKTGGKGIPSASIKILPSNAKAITDDNGQFKIDIDKHDKSIMVSYLGYKSQTIALTKAKNYEIKLELDVIKPGHTIVVGCEK